MDTPGCCLTWYLDHTVDIWKSFWQFEEKVERKCQPLLIPGLKWWCSSIRVQLLHRNVAIISTFSGVEAVTLTREQIMNHSSTGSDDEAGHIVE